MTPEEIKAGLKDVITTTIKGEDATDKLHAVLQAKMQARINPAVEAEDNGNDDNPDVDDNRTTDSPDDIEGGSGEEV